MEYRFDLKHSEFIYFFVDDYISVVVGQFLLFEGKDKLGGVSYNLFVR